MPNRGFVDLTVPKWEQTLPPTDLFEWLCPQGFCAGAPFDGIAPGIFITTALHGAKVMSTRKEPNRPQPPSWFSKRQHRHKQIS